MFSVIIGLVVFGLCGGADVVQPPGFTNTNYNGASGTFDSHSGYLRMSYGSGQKLRYVVTVPEGQQAKLIVDVTNPAYFRIRLYDFAAMFDGAEAARVLLPCNTSSYASLGKKDEDYQAIVMADTSAIRTFTSKSNVAVLDFCVSTYSSINDPSMLGFRVYWTSIGADSRPAPPASQLPSTACGTPVIPPAAALQSTKIVGGVKAPENSWPWACALVQNRGQFCDCTVLNSQWIVTAAHCTADESEASMQRSVTVYYGSQNLLTAKSARIARVIAHPQFDTPKGSTSHDVAVIKLATPIPNFPNANVAGICLPTAPLGTFVPSPSTLAGSPGRPLAFVAGWGTLFSGQSSTSAKIGSGSDQLLQATIEMLSRAECSRAFRSFPDTSICGGIDIGGRDSCQGDSGGPLVAPQADGTYGIFGIVSFGYGCAERGHPGAYSDVVALAPWIKQTVAAN